MGGYLPEAQLTGALEDFVNREMPFEDEITAEFNLLNGVEAFLSRSENLGPRTRVQYSSRLRMISGLRRSAAACSAAGSQTARKALSFLRKEIFWRRSSFSIKA